MSEEKVDVPTQEKEKKSRKRKAPEAPVENAEPRAKRDRKPVDHFQVVVQKKTVDIKEGSGTALGKIENIASALDEVVGSDDGVKLLYRVLFNKPPKVAEAKKHIKQFSGFVFGEESKEEHREKVMTKLMNGDLKQLKTAAFVLDIQAGDKTKEALANAIADFLYKPEASGRAFKSSKGAHKSKSSKKSSSDDKPKRPLSNFMIFSNERRAAVRAENPDMKPTEISKLLGEEWRGMSDSEKAKYNKGSSSEEAAAKEDKPKKEKKETKEKKEPKEKKEKKTAKKDAEEPAKKKQKKAQKQDDVEGFEAKAAELKDKVLEVLKAKKADSVKKVEAQLAQHFDAGFLKAHKDSVRSLIKETYESMEDEGEEAEVEADE